MKHNLPGSIRIISILIFLLVSIFVVSCTKENTTKYEFLNKNIAEVKNQFAPDKRVALFNIKAKMTRDDVILVGETDQPEALETLIAKIESSGSKVVDSVLMLPDSDLGGKIFGVINNSVANIRSNPKHSGELATQALLGMTVKVLKQEGEWYLIQTPDDYISWVDHGGLVVTNEMEFQQWIKSEKIIYTKANGYVYSSPDVSLGYTGDIVMGGQLAYISESGQFYEVRYPDGRQGFVRKDECSIMSQWRESTVANGDSMRTIALSLVGSPYLWGGTSVKGMDCSGFTKTVYYMNGMVIPRDASQQVHAGKVVDEKNEFKDLQVGDLLFFGRKATDSAKQKVTHVAMWIGNNEFIHSSQRVRISSIDEDSPHYDEFNKNRYLGSKRYLNNIVGNIELLTN